MICVCLFSHVQKAGFLTTQLIWAIRKLSLGFWTRSDTNWVVQQAGRKLVILDICSTRGYDSVIRRMKILVCVSIDSLWVFVLSVLNWEGKIGKVRVGLIILYKFSAKCRLLLCRSFQMISTLNSNNYMYIKHMIEACR